MKLYNHIYVRAMLSGFLSCSISVALDQRACADGYGQGQFEVQSGSNASQATGQTMSAPAASRPRRSLEGGIEQSALTGATQSEQQSGQLLQGRAAQWPSQALQGGAGQNQMQPLQGGAGQNQMQPLQGGADQSPMQPLQGGAYGNNPMALNASNDPDVGNHELDIEWDRWRNRLMQAIQAGTLAKINVHDNVNFVWDQRTQMMQSRYPNGTSAWYGLSVLPNRTIVNIRLTQSSRYGSYDQAVLQAINDLQGNSILQYPYGSRRQIVSQEANVSTAQQTSSQTFRFGDVERQRY